MTRLQPEQEHGFSLIEMVVSVGILVVIMGAVFQMVGSSQSGFRTQPEAADMQQRVRVAADMIYRDLLMAGAGPYQSTSAGALGSYFPAIRPARRGITAPDGELTFATDRISIVYVPTTRAQSALAAGQGLAAADLVIDPVLPGCPATAPCGFAAGTRALVFDDSGVGAGYELFTVTATGASTVSHGAPNLPFTRAYPTGALVSAVEHHVYYFDAANNRLMHYDGSSSDDILVENVVGLRFDYFLDPDPMSAPQPETGAANCVYTAGAPPVPLLANLGGNAAVLGTAAQFTDGPVCGVGANRFDGDLLRLRKIRVSIRVQSSLLDLRGSGTDFTNKGGSKRGDRYIPDYAVRFEVAPRNLNLIR